jgi:hypothetical protein
VFAGIVFTGVHVCICVFTGIVFIDVHFLLQRKHTPTP